MRIKFFSGSVVARALLVTNVVLGAALSITTASAQDAERALEMPKKYEGRCASTYLVDRFARARELTTQCDTAGLSDIERREMYDAAAAIMASDPSYFTMASTENRRSKKKEIENVNVTAEEAAIIKGAAEVTLQMLEKYRSKTVQLNTQSYIDENGNTGTLWCNPGPCTLGSATKHGFVAGVGTLIPFKLVEDVTKTLGEPVNKEIFNITLDALLASAGTSADRKLKSAAEMTKKQIKSNQLVFEKSQENKGGSSIVVETPVEETPVVEAPVEEAPVEEAPVEEDHVEEAPVEEAPVEEAPVEEAPVEEAPVEEAPVEEAPVEEAPVEEAPVEEAPVEEAPVEEAPVEEDHVEEAPVEEDHVEEAPVDEGTEALVEEWDDDCAGMDQCNIPIEGVDF
jgi:hypothetical protein